MKKTFETPGPITVRVRIPAGHISVETVPGDETEVQVEPAEGSGLPRIDSRRSAKGSVVTVEAEEDRRFWRRRSYRVSVRCPEGSDVEVRTASADLEGRGLFAALDARSASGQVRVDSVAGPVAVNTASGDIELGQAHGSVEVHSVSGKVAIGLAGGPARVTSASGDLRVGRAEGSVEGHSVSGHQRIDAVAAGSVWLETVSGDVEVGVLPGVELWLDLQSLSGQVLSELTSSNGLEGDVPAIEIRLKSVSGDLRVYRSRVRVSDAG
jgi:DUF4097 and DUF4098 domain-containing protein YvlB